MTDAAGRDPTGILVHQAARALVGRSDGLVVEAALRSGPAWAEVLGRAHRHGVVAGLTRALAGREPVPDDARTLVAGSADAVARRNLALTGTLLRVLDALEQAGLRPLAFKGAALSASAYGDLAVRQYLDNDVLIAREEVGAAEEVLAGLGYRPIELVPEERRADLLRRRAGRPFSSDDLVGPVDLHWSFAPWSASIEIPTDDLLARAAEVDLGRRTVWTLAPEDLLIALCVHGNRHRWTRLLWVVDVAALIGSTPALAWVQVLDRAESWRVVRMLLVGLALAVVVCDAPLPPHILALLGSDRVALRLARGRASALFDEPDDLRQAMPLTWFDLLAREHASDGGRLLARSVFGRSIPEWTERDRAGWSAVERPLRLLRTYGPGIVSSGRDELRRRIRPSLTPALGRRRSSLGRNAPS